MPALGAERTAGSVSAAQAIDQAVEFIEGAELDRQLDPFIPGVFRGQAAMDPRLSFEQVEKNRLPPEVLRELNHF